MASISQQLADLRSARDAERAEIAAVADRVSKRLASLQEKIVSLGEVDPDLQSDVDSVKADIEQLKTIAPDETPVPAPEPTPTPVEPATEEPA